MQSLEEKIRKVIIEKKTIDENSILDYVPGFKSFKEKQSKPKTQSEIWKDFLSRSVDALSFAGPGKAAKMLLPGAGGKLTKFKPSPKMEIIPPAASAKKTPSLIKREAEPAIVVKTTPAPAPAATAKPAPAPAATAKTAPAPAPAATAKPAPAATTTAKKLETPKVKVDYPPPAVIQPKGAPAPAPVSPAPAPLTKAPAPAPAPLTKAPAPAKAPSTAPAPATAPAPKGKPSLLSRLSRFVRRNPLKSLALASLLGGIRLPQPGAGTSGGSISTPGAMIQLHRASPSSGLMPVLRNETEYNSNLIESSIASKERQSIENVSRPKLKRLRNALSNKQGEIERKIIED